MRRLYVISFILFFLSKCRLPLAAVMQDWWAFSGLLWPFWHTIILNNINASFSKWKQMHDCSKLPVHCVRVQCHALDRNCWYMKIFQKWTVWSALLDPKSDFFFFKLCVGFWRKDAMYLVCLMLRHVTDLISGVGSVNACQHFRPCTDDACRVQVHVAQY